MEGKTERKKCAQHDVSVDSDNELMMERSTSGTVGAGAHIPGET